MKTLTFADLRNNSGKEFVDISSEQYRVYINPAGEVLKHIVGPIALCATETSHRVLDEDGVSHWIKMDDVSAIEWEAKPDQPHFVK